MPLILKSASPTYIQTTQQSWSNVTLSTTAAATVALGSAVTLTLGTSNGTNGNWRVIIRAACSFVDYSATSLVSTVHFGVISTNSGTSEAKMFYNAAVHTSSFTNCVSDSATFVAGSSVSGGGLIYNTGYVEYQGTYANGIALSFAINASQDGTETIHSTGFISIQAIPQ